MSPLTPFQGQRIERGLDERFDCRGCHQISGRGGLIGPSLDGIRERADYDYVLRMIRDPTATLPGTIMPHQRMPDREARRLARYLMSLPLRQPIEGPREAPPALMPGEEVDGAALYARHCVACHGSQGRGDGWNARTLPVMPTVHADAELMAKRPDDTLYDAIAAGAFVLDGSPMMPAFGDLLSEAQIRALVGHIRKLCDCQQPSWAGERR